MVTGNRGAQIVDLRKVRVDRLGDGLKQRLARGHVIVPTAGVGSIEEWRDAARSLGRDQGWRVRTGVATEGQHVWAARVDLEPSPVEAEHDRERIRYLGAAITP